MWKQEHQDAFDSPKQAFLSTPVLRHADVAKTFIVACDSLNVNLGAVLLQDHEGVKQPVVYLSKKLEQTKHDWIIYNKELAAV